MGSLFSKPKKAPVKQLLEKDRAILNLKVARDKLRKYRSKLETDSKKLEAQAKELIGLRLKNRALLVLKLKRFKEKELDGIDAKLMTVQSQIDDVEWASINVSILKAIESGTRELNRIHEERSLEDVEMLMDETNEAIEVENRINQVLAGQLSVVDEAELEAELEAIMTGISAAAPTSTSLDLKQSQENVVDSVSKIPSVPEVDPVSKTPVPDDTLVLPDVPITPLLPLAPMNGIDIVKTQTIAVSQPT